MLKLSKQIEKIVKDLFDVDEPVILTRPDEQFGDYASNVALSLSKKIGQSSAEVAKKIADEVTKLDEVSKAEVAGPGFINITLIDAVLIQSATEKPDKELEGQTILTEYSDPNPLKPLHAGHLYTTLVGDVISRLLENAGAKVIRLNYGGDVGLHVARSMWGIIRELGGEHPEKLDEIPESQRANWLGKRYVEGTTADESDDESVKQKITEYNQRVYQLHEQNDHESPFAQIYWKVREWSYDYFKVLYDQLQVHPFDRFIPESEVTPLAVQTVQEQLEQGVFEKSEGAIVFKGEGHDLHTRVFISSTGIPLYEAKDVGLSLTKWQDYHFDRSVIITANEQAQYMQVVIKAIEQFAPEPASKTTHLTHGMVKLKGKVAMSSRKGNVLLALDVLEAARQAAKKVNDQVDETTVLAAVKYAFSKPRLGGDIIYDPEESVAITGNSGPYLQYAHARARSILNKVGREGTLEMELLQLDEGERSLVRKIGEFKEVVEKATQELSPHHIANYLYELAQRFNQFYENSRVVGDEREALRLSLVKIYANTLKAGLELLGIHAANKM